MTMRAQCTKGAFANALSGRAALGGGQPCARLALGFGDLARAHVLVDFGAAHLRFLAAVDGGEIEPFVRLDEIDALAAGAGRIENSEIETSVPVSDFCFAQPALALIISV